MQLQNTTVSAEKIRHNINSSNLPYYEAVWAVAKRSREVSKFRKWFYWEKSPSKAQQQERKPNGPSEPPAPSKVRKQHSALVDVVAESGDLWIKVSTITANRIIFDLAKLGWVNDSEDEDEDMPMSMFDDDSDDEDDVGLLRIAKDLIRASKANPSHAKRPNILFVLPRVKTGNVKEVDKVLSRIEDMGITIITEAQMNSQPIPPISKVLPRLLVDELKGLSSVLNVDCTILLALVSDISHHDVETQAWFPRAVKQQIEVERKNKLLPSVLYPVMVGRDLVTTKEAAKRMREITDTIGTETEKERTALLMGDKHFDSREAITSAWTQLSNHTIPNNLLFPIKTVDKASKGDLGTLPPIAKTIGAQLSEINYSVFFFGWKSGYTTISSNGTVAHQIEKAVEENRDPDDEDAWGPGVWLCPESRSLVAKKGHGDFASGSSVRRIIHESMRSSMGQ